MLHCIMGNLPTLVHRVQVQDLEHWKEEEY